MSIAFFKIFNLHNTNSVFLYYLGNSLQMLACHFNFLEIKKANSAFCLGMSAFYADY